MPQYPAREDQSKCPPAEDSFGKPWSSGRLLSDAQRDRKRMMNRVSQLKRRENLKSSLNSIDRRLLNIEKRCLQSPQSTVKAKESLTCSIPATNLIARSLRTESFPYTDPAHLSLRDRINESMTLYDSLNEILRSVYHINRLHVCTDDGFNQDALIRGVILGWGVLEKEFFTCPIWAILSHIDMLLMANTTVATRITLLRGIHLMLLSRICPERLPPLPPWFRPRNCEPSNSSNTIIDYFAWPRFRDKLRASNYPPLTNQFWFHFIQNVRFEWPFSPAHTIDMDRDSGKYQFTMPFRDAKDVIQRYTMGQYFFIAYPDCYGDIPLHGP